MAYGTRMKTMEALLSQLNETVSNLVKPQLAQLTESVANHSTTIAETSVSFQRMEVLLQSLVHRANASSTSSHGAVNFNHDMSKAPFQMRNVKLEFPKFDGTHAFEWIFKVEQFFDYYGTPDHERLTIAAVHMDQAVIP